MDCPKCGLPVTVPRQDTEHPKPIPSVTPQLAASRLETKQCPFCAETIKARAIVCRYCGRDLVAKPITEAVTEKVQGGPLPSAVRKLSLGDGVKIAIGVLLVFIVFGGIVVLGLEWWQQRRPDYTLDGQVFVVREGGESVRRGLVPIALISCDALLPYLSNKVTTATKEIARLEPLIKAAQEKEAQQEAQHKAELARLKAEDDTLERQYMSASYDDPAKNELYAKERAAEDAYLSAIRKGPDYAQPTSFELEAEQVHYQTDEYYFHDLPAPFRNTKTDADGKFQMQVPRVGSYALAAHASIGGEYYWLLPVNPREKSPAKIMLANDNVFEPKSVDWPWLADTTAQSP